MCPKCGEKIEYNTRAHLRRADRLRQQCKRCKISYELTSGHYSAMGRISVVSQNKRSKNEIYFAELCQKQFANVLCNSPIFNGWDADVILPGYKIAILWNGKWHYERLSVKHSLCQVQTRDKIKLDEIAKSGYDAYIVKDDGKFDKRFVEEEFKKLVEFIELRGTVLVNWDVS